MAGMLNRWSRKAQASSERRNADAKLKPRPGELSVETCERVIGEPVLWAATATRGRHPGGAGTFIDPTPPDLGLIILAVVGVAHALAWGARRIRRRPSEKREGKRLPDTLALAGTRDAICELDLSGPHPARVAARHVRPMVTPLGTEGYWQQVRIDDQELWVMTHLTKRILQQAAAWRGQG